MEDTKHQYKYERVQPLLRLPTSSSLQHNQLHTVAFRPTAAPAILRTYSTRV